MQNIYLELLVILILVVLNGILAMSEIAVVSSRKMKLQKMRKEGIKGADIVLELIDSPNQFLSTIQIGITLIGIVAGAFGGATIALSLENYIDQFELLRPYSDFISVFTVVLFITYLSLIIGELVPKRIAIDNPERVAVKIAKPMKILSNITKPVVYFLSESLEIVLKILGIKKPKEEVVAEDEIRMLIEEGRRTGEFEKTEEDIIKRVFDLDNRKINSLMTPKTEITWLDINSSEEELLNLIFETRKSVFPVSDGYLDNFMGVVKAKDLFKAKSEEKEFNIKKHLKEPLIVPESSYALNVLKLFKESAENVHMALVVDEYGDVEGLVTLYDILEAIVGDLPPEELEEKKIFKRADGSYLIDGSINIEEFKSIFKIKELPDEDTSNYQTLAGFIMTYLGEIPETAYKFKWNDLQFEIMDLDGFHIDKVMVYQLATKK
ncbi:MAG: hemolysin family protein [Methanobacterium sp.]|jgi:putative hemolysin